MAVLSFIASVPAVAIDFVDCRSLSEEMMMMQLSIPILYQFSLTLFNDAMKDNEYRAEVF
jgi:hypothetical protein